ncbi:F-box protein [Melia azedarach]|uniref:F-box protein n=1 Tax=Melia azedarach TaxID=155640 RepID=A0ACC1Z4S2_MELAZ|nr:F-box protein [Melia azedarach]
MANDADKFSHLPDDIIVLIISFLPFIDAYRLCLSRKDWREKALWLYCTCLDLHEIHFLLPGTRQYWLSIGKRVQSMEMKRIGKIRYVDFLNKTVTNLASPSLSKFSFRFYYSSDRYHENIDKWIKVALSKGVKELSIDFSDGDPLEPQPMLLTPQYVLPNFLYQDGMCLKVLNISSCGLGYCNFQGFIRLRTLTLTRVRLFWGEIEHMVVSCPYLETMSLVECYRLIKVHISFVFLRLKKFILRHCEPLTLGVELCFQDFNISSMQEEWCNSVSANYLISMK